MLKPANIRVNRQRLGKTPREQVAEGGSMVFSWALWADDCARAQRAFRVTVRDDENQTWADSGWTECSAQEYACMSEGWPRGERLTVCVSVRDAQGHEGGSQAAFYLGDISWQAEWIAADQDIGEAAAYFARTFRVDKPVKRATLYACGLGYHELRINGDRVDDALLDPAYTDYTKSCQYVVIPQVERLIRPGENRLDMALGGGWRRTQAWCGQEKQPRRTRYYGEKQLILMLKLTYADGCEQTVSTDGSWKWGLGPIVQSSMFDGETHDARRAVEITRPVSVVPGPGGVLRPMLIPPVREKAVYRPIAISCVDGGKWIVDFGQNIAGVVRLSIPALPEGQAVTVRHSEFLDEDGTLYTAPLRNAKATDTYISDGKSALWQPRFTYHGFRYAEVSGFCPEMGDIEGVQMYTDLDKDSFFRCGSALLNAFQHNVVMTERDNMHSVLTDCPQRDERMGWMNDATVRFEEFPFNFESGAMLRKIVRDLREGQQQDGAISCTCPFAWYGFYPADPVCSSYLVAAWQNYLHNGDVETIRENFDGFAAWEQCLLNNSEGYIVGYSYYGDWAGPSYACEAEEKAKSAVTPGQFMSTGYSYYNCVLLERFARILGREEQAEKYRALAGEIRRAMLEKWYDPQTAQMATGSQACQAFSLWLGILPESDRARAAKHMRDDLVAREYRFTTGNLCTRYLLDMLCEYGYADEAYELMTREEYPSFGYQIQQEATTVWERFELKKNGGMNSHNHPMYGAAGSWLYTHLAGIRPTGAGFETVEIAPCLPQKLMSAQAAVETAHGRIQVRWVRRYGGAHLYVDLPVGVTATVRFGGREYRAEAGSSCFHDGQRA